jgi:hexosaminidase
VSRRLALAALISLVSAAPAAATRPATIPALRDWRPATGSYVLRDSARIVVPAGGPLAEARLLAADLPRRLPVVAGSAPLPGDIEIALGAAGRRLGREGYRLEVGPVLRIEARTAAGAFYGTRSVVQLLRRRRSIPAGTARDWPRYPERGLMLDNGRRYFGPRWLRARIRELADLKLNQLHLHFSDDQGFRVASSSHPEIVSDPHLTKREVRSLVSYARARHIRVIPEIDMPGHMGAALARHPHLRLAPTRLDVTKPAARRFTRELILEYLDLFPGRYWHGGADEYLLPADYALYPRLERYTRAHYGAGANGADAYLGFVNWMDRLVRSRGRTLRVWNDGLADGRAVKLRSDVVVDWWAGHSGPSPRALVARGHRILNAGWWPTYYVVGAVGGLHASMRIAYESWAVNRFHGLAFGLEPPGTPPVVLPRGLRRNLGSELHVWNDDPDGETDSQTARGIAPRLRVLAQKTWDSPRPAPSYAGFQRIAHATTRLRP